MQFRILSIIVALLVAPLALAQNRRVPNTVNGVYRSRLSQPLQKCLEVSRMSSFLSFLTG
jgi:hypothetical protein